MTKPLFIFATELEAKPYIQNLKNELRQLWTKTFIGPDYDVLISGIGLTATAISCSQIQNEYSYWLNLGICGSLKDEYSLGDILQMNSVSCLDEKHPFDRQYDILDLDSSYDLPSAQLLSVGKALHDSHKRHALSQTYDLVDMETYAIAMSALWKGQKLKSLKIVSDQAKESDQYDIVKMIPVLMDKLKDYTFSHIG